MKNNDFMKKTYNNFSDFVRVASSRELSYFLLDAKYTSGFSSQMNRLISELRKEGNLAADFVMFFNTDGEIAIFDEDLLGTYIGDRFLAEIESKYGNKNLNYIIKSVINNSDSVQKDFAQVCYEVIVNILDEIYMEMKYKKDLGEFYKKTLSLDDESIDNLPLKIAALLIVEDMCRYLGINIPLKQLIK
ncbi:hypothetical protein CSC2_42090 [Clostridium zeae]|uniref:Uncharacterized protein n=1 Tax=Clostridium zeae TaxID=2759022 RepID=A0ABQ1EFT0_9CLOT|nr:hypothetical protein [Clostridium zeae]GFZ33683.1 hypothetical protein CSC2_42090 [Clostridium zeae]